MAMNECVDPTKHLNVFSNTQFIERIQEEKRKLEVLRMQEIQSTVENPRIRERCDTSDICQEYSAQKQKELIERTRRIQLRENEPELRKLMHQLRKANVCRLRMEQRKDHDKVKQKKIQEKLIEETNFLKEISCNEDSLKKQRIAQEEEKRKLRDAMLKQINDNIKIKNKIHEETIFKERQALIELMANLEEERKAQLEIAAIKREFYRNLSKEGYEMLEKRKLAESAEKTTNYDCFATLLEHDNIPETLLKKKHSQLRQRQLTSEEMGLNILKLTTEKMRKQDLLTDLLVEERLAKEELREYHEKEKEIRDKMLLHLEYEFYKEDTLQRRKELKKAEQEALKHYKPYQYSECNGLEEKKRKLAEENKCNLLQMIKINQRRKKHRKYIDLIDDQMLLHAEWRKQNEIDIERLHLLAQEPIESLRLLPAGVISDSEEKVLNVKSYK